MKLTKEQIRIKIAELCGAKIIEKEFPRTDGIHVAKKWAWGGNEDTPCGYSGGGSYGFGWNENPSVSELPDYPHDLNGCAEMEGTLTKEQRKTYVFWLSNICELGTYVFATAIQRCLAFLAVHGIEAEVAE